MCKTLLAHLLLLPVLAALGGCCAQTPRVMVSTPPDKECQTGVEVGLDIALWQCVDGEHVVAYRRSSAFGCSAIQVERVPCGQFTPLERKSDGDACRNGHPVSHGVDGGVAGPQREAASGGVVPDGPDIVATPKKDHDKHETKDEGARQ